MPDNAKKLREKAFFLRELYPLIYLSVKIKTRLYC